jgi:hypothetical protein
MKRYKGLPLDPVKVKLKPEEARLHAQKITRGHRFGKRWFPY